MDITSDVICYALVGTIAVHMIVLVFRMILMRDVEVAREGHLQYMLKSGYSKTALYFLVFFATSRQVQNAYDKHHSRGLELAMYRHLLRTLRKKSGEQVEETREQLEETIKYIEETPLREAAVDGDDYVALIAPHLEQLKLASREAEKIFVEDRRQHLLSR